MSRKFKDFDYGSLAAKQEMIENAAAVEVDVADALNEFGKLSKELSAEEMCELFNKVPERTSASMMKRLLRHQVNIWVPGPIDLHRKHGEREKGVLLMGKTAILVDVVVGYFGRWELAKHDVVTIQCDGDSVSE